MLFTYLLHSLLNGKMAMMMYIWCDVLSKFYIQDCLLYIYYNLTML